jgi:flavodoxin I
MKYAIIYSSHTGNTEQLAQQIHTFFKHDECVYYGHPSSNDIHADILFIGFWTDKGTCDGPLQDYLKKIKNQKIFLFGTAGFGGSSQYFQTILHNILSYIDTSNEIIGTYMCQGKMPVSIRERYAKLAKDNPQKFLPLIDNFDQALSHPNEKDIQSLINQLQSLPR